MNLSAPKLRKICARRHLSLTQVLLQAKVSRTAYYSLVRKPSLLPQSILRIARQLEVNPSALLDDESATLQAIRRLQNSTDAICRQNPGVDRDTVFRTLQNLQLPPLDRLRRALYRVRKSRHI